ncbi:MAG TPA: SGNH/GDSL hydrolase family protein [Pseudonocardiaceae bacterium]
MLSEQSRRARRIIGMPPTAPLRADGVYLPDGTGPLPVGDATAEAPIRLAVLGDSSAAGVGAEVEAHLPGVLVARGLAEESERPVRLDTYAVSGSTSRDLTPQVELALANTTDVVLALIGANDVTKLIPPRTAAAQLGEAVRRLGASGVAVVVGTCPDLGVIRPIPQPLRGVARSWSLTLARLQRVAVQRAGGRAVPLADLLAAEFLTRADLFARDQFHPSDAGYEAAAAVLLPAVCAAVGVWDGGPLPRLPGRSTAAEALRPTARLAAAANRRLDRMLRRAA